LQSRFEKIKLLAYRELIDVGCSTLQITEHHDFYFEGKKIIITSLQNYALLTNTPIEQLTLNGSYDDGMCIKGLRDILLVLYNRNKIHRRRRFTVLHEIGHIKCNHKQHGKQEEIEACFFASEFLAPTPLLLEIKQRGYEINTAFLTEHFGISIQAAEKKLKQLESTYTKNSKLEQELLVKFKDCLDEKFPLTIHSDNTISYSPYVPSRFSLQNNTGKYIEATAPKP